MLVAPRTSTRVPGASIASVALDVDACARHRKFAPPVLLTTACVVVGGGVVGAGVVGAGVGVVGVGVWPPEIVRYAAEAHPFCPAHRIGTHPLIVEPRTSTRVPGANEVNVVLDVVGWARQRRLAPPVLLTVAVAVVGGFVGVGVGVVGVGVGVVGGGVWDSVNQSVDIHPFLPPHVTGAQPLNTFPRSVTRVPDDTDVMTPPETDGVVLHRRLPAVTVPVLAGCTGQVRPHGSAMSGIVAIS